MTRADHSSVRNIADSALRTAVSGRNHAPQRFAEVTIFATTSLSLKYLSQVQAADIPAPRQSP